MLPWLVEMASKLSEHTKSALTIGSVRSAPIMIISSGSSRRTAAAPDAPAKEDVTSRLIKTPSSTATPRKVKPKRQPRLKPPVGEEEVVEQQQVEIRPLKTSNDLRLTKTLGGKSAEARAGERGDR